MQSHRFIPDASRYLCDAPVGNDVCGMPRANGVHAEPTALATSTDVSRDGTTFIAPMDEKRLNAQARRVWQFIKDGNWHTLTEISAGSTAPEASVSARLRDFRKAEFGGHVIDTRRTDSGAWEYRLRVRVPADR